MTLICVFVVTLFFKDNQGSTVPTANKEQWPFQLKSLEIAIRNQSKWRYFANQTSRLAAICVSGDCIISRSDRSSSQFISRPIPITITHQFVHYQAATLSRIKRSYHLKSIGHRQKVNRLNLDIIRTQRHKEHQILFDYLIIPKEYLLTNSARGWWMEISYALTVTKNNTKEDDA